MIRKLKARGGRLIYISHHLDEVVRDRDRGTVLRDGEYIATAGLKDTSEDTDPPDGGSRAGSAVPEVVAQRGAEVLRVEGLSRTGGVCEDINLRAARGRDPGHRGVGGRGPHRVGARRSSAPEPIEQWQIYVFGTAGPVGFAAGRHQAGMGLLPEDRK